MPVPASQDAWLGAEATTAAGKVDKLLYSASCWDKAPSLVAEDAPPWQCELYPPAGAEMLVVEVESLLERIRYIPQHAAKDRCAGLWPNTTYSVLFGAVLGSMRAPPLACVPYIHRKDSQVTHTPFSSHTHGMLAKPCLPCCCVRLAMFCCRFLQEVVGNMLQQAHGRIVRMLQQAELFKDVGGLAWVPKVCVWYGTLALGGAGCCPVQHAAGVHAAGFPMGGIAGVLA
jgi:hypothetical protein